LSVTGAVELGARTNVRSATETPLTESCKLTSTLPPLACPQLLASVSDTFVWPVYTTFGSGEALTVHSVHNGPLKPDWQAHVPLPLMPSRQLPNAHTGQALQLAPKDPDTQLLHVAPWKLLLQLHAPVPLYP